MPQALKRKGSATDPETEKRSGARLVLMSTWTSGNFFAGTRTAIANDLRPQRAGQRAHESFSKILLIGRFRRPTFELPGAAVNGTRQLLR